jgi:pantoate--beta-alanine ligase
MEIVRRVRSMREIARRERVAGRKIGFVPTMGALHEGHLSLIRRAREIADVVIVSIYVNPAQFGPDEDLARYPRDLTADADLCIADGVDYLFTPETAEIYPDGHGTSVDVGELGKILEGAVRPGHFNGVATVVLKLFQIVRPTVALFGQKDAQQALVVRRLVRDLLLDTEILILPIVRDDDGLALSSRNRYLRDDQRRAAAALPRALEAARHVVAEGQRRPEEIVVAAREVLEAEPLIEVDYVELVDTTKMRPVESVDGETLLVLAARIGGTRLLDNATIRVSSEN